MSAIETRKRNLRFAALLVALAGVVFSAALVAQQAPPTAGAIVTMVPVGNIERTGVAAPGLTAQRGMAVQWGDTVKTQRGGRVRIRLEDGSILNVGSQSAMVIQKHDAREQNTEIDLLYGKLRSNATRIVRPGGQFKVKTRAATAGVVGTEKYLEASEISTTVVALGGGNVVVTSTDARFADPVTLVPGETVTMAVGRPPGQKRAATTEELSRAVAETDSDPIVQLTPGQAAPGSRTEATITGRGLDTARGFSFAQAGIQVTARGAATATSIPVTITVGADVPAGTYPITIDRPSGPATGTLVVTAREAAGGGTTPSGPGMVLPATAASGGSSSGMRGAKITFDAANAQTPQGTQIVRYEWRVLNTQLRSSDSTFLVNTSLLAPGNYNVELTVTNDRGQTATQRYPLTVQAGTQPAEILRLLATAYESLQPNEFLRYFDEQKFRNFAGFSGAIEDSFRSQIQSIRVFQRAVNCQVLEEQDQAICQADFELQFTKKDQPSQLLDAAGNLVPPGTTAPPGSRLGKAVQTGFERNTIRFERGEQGWKIVDYGTVVSCPGGGSTTGVSVGSCVLAIGSGATPTFQLVNLQLSSNSLALGGTVTGAIEIQALAGYTGQVNLTGQAQVSNQRISVQFNTNPASAGQIVGFTVTGPSTAPMGFTGATAFTLVITGQDTSGTLTASVNAPMSLQPDYTLTVSPTTAPGAPLSVTHNSTTNVQVTVVAGPGFTGNVIVDFPNLPAGFSVAPGTVPAGSTASFPLNVSAAASPGPALVTVRSASSANVVRTSSLFAVVASDFTLTASSPTGFAASPGGSFRVDVNVVPISGFAGAVVVDFIGLSPGLTPAPVNATVAAGGTTNFTVSVASGTPLGGISMTIRGTFLATVRTLPVNGNVQTAPPVAGQTAMPAVITPKTTASQTPPARTVAPASSASSVPPPPPMAVPPGASQQPQGAPARIERARVRLAMGGCTGFRFAAASEGPCGGASDIELTASASGELTLEAEGVAAVGSVALDQYSAASATPSLSSRNAVVQPGVTYLVQHRGGRAVMRVTGGRNLSGRGAGAQAVMAIVEWRVLPKQ